jgi:hypothetical protein
MEYKHTTILNSREFISPDSEGVFFYVDTDRYISKHTKNQVLKVQSEIKCSYVVPWGEGFLINENVYFDKLRIIKLSRQDNIFFSLVINDRYAIAKEIDFALEKVKMGLFDKSNFEIFWYDDQNSYGNPFLTLSNNSFLSFLTDTEIACFDIQGKKEWHVDFRDLVGAKEVIFLNQILVACGKLFFVLVAQSKKGIFILNAQSGREVKFYSDVTGFLTKDTTQIYSVKQPNILCIIDMENNDYYEWDVNKLIKEHGFESINDHRCTAEDGVLYFTQGIGAENSKAGALDTFNKELVWKHDFKKENGGIKTINVHEGNIYINMQDDTIQFFQKIE